MRSAVVHNVRYQALPGAGLTLEQEHRHSRIAGGIQAHELLELRPQGHHGEGGAYQTLNGTFCWRGMRCSRGHGNPFSELRATDT